MTGWQTHASTTTYENAWIRVREDAVTRPDGGRGIYGVVEMRQPSVFVVAITDDGAVVLVDLYRYTTDRWSIEVPAGGSDGEEPLAAARRELREETGLEAANWTPLASTWALNGVCRAPEHVFLARSLTEVGGAALAEEGITRVRRVPWPQVFAMVSAGQIDDAETLAALLCAAVALGRVA